MAHASAGASVRRPAGAVLALLLAVAAALVPVGVVDASAQGPPLDPPAPDHEGLVVTINLPAHEVEVWRGGERIRRYAAAIGLPGYPTPTGAFEIDRIVWNPWWNPPPSDWARNESRTPPGPRNPMGRAKLRFEGLLYLHGTGNPADLGGAVSHGCVRISNEDVLDLARLLALETGALDEEAIDRLERNASATREVELPDAVPLRIRYRVAERSGGEIRTFEDVYGYGVTEDERDLIRRSDSRDAESRAAPSSAPHPDPEDRWKSRR